MAATVLAWVVLIAAAAYFWLRGRQSRTRLARIEAELRRLGCRCAGCVEHTGEPGPVGPPPLLPRGGGSGIVAVGRHE